MVKKKECPSCAMEIDTDAAVCPVCGYEFPRKNRGYTWIAILLAILILLWMTYIRYKVIR
jgi:RNA polymerase subunit RPABC4/transcription elongation factor Spt4